VQNVFAKFNGWWVPMIIMFFRNRKSENRIHWKSPLKDKAHLSPLKYKGTPPTHLSGVTDCTCRFRKCQGLHSTMEQAGYAMSLVRWLAVPLGSTQEGKQVDVCTLKCSEVVESAQRGLFVYCVQRKIEALNLGASNAF
jgi:hypothetical protein